MRRPKGIKTRKSVAKRFKITAAEKYCFTEPAAPFASRQEPQTPPVLAKGLSPCKDRRLSHPAEFAVQPLDSIRVVEG